ncbi:MAG: hypothetical protein GC149_20535 [Gammaproteobacteria bacterium]|nr:hypothetical protein [Gammaproteobacteria bacterium]
MNDDKMIYAGINHGESPFFPKKFMFRLNVWGFTTPEEAEEALYMIAHGTKHIFDFADPADPLEVKSRTELPEGDVCIHLVPHNPISKEMYPGFTIMADGYDTEDEATSTKEKFIQAVTDLTGLNFQQPN